MEDVLEVYHRDYGEREALVCLDETSKQLVGETRQPRPARRGSPMAYDYVIAAVISIPLGILAAVWISVHRVDRASWESGRPGDGRCDAQSSGLASDPHRICYSTCCGSWLNPEPS